MFYYRNKYSNRIDSFSKKQQTMSSDFWEEVIVSVKPKPKTYTHKIALFSDFRCYGGALFPIDLILYNKNRHLHSGVSQLSDRTEVTFIELTTNS